MASKKDAKGRKNKDAVNAQHDPTRALAYILRGSKGPEARSARLEDNRVDYFRGKDLFRLLRKQPELVDEYAPQLAGVPTPYAPTPKEREAQITAIGQYLLQKAGRGEAWGECVSRGGGSVLAACGGFDDPLEHTAHDDMSTSPQQRDDRRDLSPPSPSPCDGFFGFL